MSVCPPEPRLGVALDCDPAQARILFERLKQTAGLFKVGQELFLAGGPDVVGALVDSGARLFLDLKFHDIPRTVAASAREAARLGVAMFNVHAAGGVPMMRAAVEAARETRPGVKVLGVTVLTSLASTEDRVLRLAESAAEAGLDGVITSAVELRILRRRMGSDFILVALGIRPEWAAEKNDQCRVATPAQAVADGADYLVVGRPILSAPDPAAAASRIAEEMRAAIL